MMEARRCYDAGATLFATRGPGARGRVADRRPRNPRRKRPSGAGTAELARPLLSGAVMKSTSRAGLRWLATGLFLAVVAASLAACKGTVALDCSGAPDEENGLVSCGVVQAREKTAQCKSQGQGTAAMCTSEAECQTDADCLGALGRCDSGQINDDCGCTTGCMTDADCVSGAACLCGENGGRCVQAGCKTSDDCGPERSCLLYQIPESCLSYAHPAFACTTDHDECLSDADCAGSDTCFFDGDHFKCGSITCDA